MVSPEVEALAMRLWTSYSTPGAPGVENVPLFQVLALTGQAKCA